MKQPFFICLLLCWHTLAFCQTGALTGSVTDAETKTPLELATVVIRGQDSAVIAYKLSDKEGKFFIDKLPLKKQLLVNVTYTGYKSYNQQLLLESSKTDTLNAFLALSNFDSVVVTAAIPVRMNGDTLEINPAAFQMKEDAVVEELLNQVSGVTIWSDGSITVNGRKVQSLLVDGKSFMGSSDARVATQNLPKSAIDKIQLYQEYDRSKIGQPTQPQDSLLTMNIKLKEESKKGYFGKMGAGYGTTDRYESDLSLQAYNKRSNMGIGGGINNINKNIGNIQEMFQNNTYRNYNPNLYNVGRFGTNGINRNYSLGGVYVHSFIESSNSRQNNRVTVNYNTSGTKSYVTNLSLQNRAVADDPQFIRGEGTQNGHQSKHDIGVNYIKTNSYNDNFSLNGTAHTENSDGTSSRVEEVRDSANQLLSSNITSTQQNQTSNAESLNVDFSTSDSENPLKKFNIQLNGNRSNSTSQRTVKSDFESFTDISQNYYNDRHYATDNQSVTLSGHLNYGGFKRLLLGRYNLFGIDIGLDQQVNYSRVSSNNLVTDYDSTSKQYTVNDGLSNDNKKELFAYSPQLSLVRNIMKYNEKHFHAIAASASVVNDFKTDKNSSSISQRNLNRSFSFFRYQGGLSYQYQKHQKYRYYVGTNYSKDWDYPEIDQLYTIVDDINAYNIQIGNPNLKNSSTQSISLNGNFNTEAPKSLYSIRGNIGARYAATQDAVTDSTINDPSGKRISYFVNTDKGTSLSASYNINLARRLNKNSIQLGYNTQFSNRKFPNYVDGVSNTSQTTSFSHYINLQFSLSSLLVLNTSYSLQTNKSRPSAPGLSAFKTSNNTTRAGLVLNYPANFSFSSTVDRITSSYVDQPTVLWNAFASYRCMKQQAEFKLSAMDILKQYRNISNSADIYGTTTTITNGLQQYFLLTFSYYPRKFGKKAPRPQTMY